LSSAGTYHQPGTVLLSASHGGGDMDATTCPECGAPAEIVDRGTLTSTSGPLEVVKLHCVRRHWYLLPTASLTVWPPAPRPVAARR
jgi:hypothetical protein